MVDPMRMEQDMSMGKCELEEWITILGFCAFDMMLYLDTHPKDKEALDYYNQCSTLYQSAKKNYEERFGQLSAFSSGPWEDWEWNSAPMPWEGGK